MIELVWSLIIRSVVCLTASLVERDAASKASPGDDFLAVQDQFVRQVCIEFPADEPRGCPAGVRSICSTFTDRDRAARQACHGDSHAVRGPLNRGADRLLLGDRLPLHSERCRPGLSPLDRPSSERSRFGSSPPDTCHRRGANGIGCRIDLGWPGERGVRRIRGGRIRGGVVTPGGLRTAGSRRRLLCKGRTPQQQDHKSDA